MTRFRPASPDQITPGAVLFAEADALGIPADDDRVNDGRALVRVLSSDDRSVTVSVFGVALARIPILTLSRPVLYLQADTPGDPTQPLSVQEHPDKARTQLAYPAGIDMGVVSTPKPAAVLARPAILDADSKVWQLECPTCPLSADGPKMVCAWGKRLDSGSFMLTNACPHNTGLRQNQETKRVTTGCSYSGVEQ